MVEQKSIVVTGISGTIMKYLLPEMAWASSSVTALSRRWISSTDVTEVLEGELTDEEFLNRSLIGADTVIHAAALTRSANAAKLKKSNEDVTEALIRAAEQNGVQRFIFFSSDLATFPVGPYGQSKHNCEDSIRNSQLKDWVILRLSSFFGGDDPKDNSTVSKLINIARKGRPIFLPSRGQFYIAPIGPLLLEPLLTNIINHKGVLKKIYNVAGEKILLAELIQKLAGGNARIFGVPMTILNPIIHTLPVLGIRHPIFETLRALSHLPISPDQSLADDFGFSATALDCVIEESS